MKLIAKSIASIALIEAIVSPAFAVADTTSVLVERDATPATVSMAWYAGWESDSFPVTAVPWSKYTHVAFSFAETSPSTGSVDLSGSGGSSALKSFVSAAHSNHVKALLTIGGWTGCRWYSWMVGSASNRTAFVNTVSSLVSTYQLDGLDFDWEYPGTQGLGCNKVSSKDVQNFGLFLAQLRQKVGSKTLLTAATSVFPWVDSTGKSATNLTSIAHSLDWIELMNYDVWGTWSASFGPNAPLNDACASSANQQGSATSGIAKWHAAGFPYSHIILGVPAYGHNATVTNKNAFVSGSTTTLKPYPAFEPVPNVPSLGPDACGNPQQYDGEPNYSALVASKIITKAGDPASTMIGRWDDCSQTPFVYNPKTQQMYSYDNPKSLKIKGQYVKSNGLRGFAIWEASGDGKHTTLLDALRSGAGMST